MAQLWRDCQFEQQLLGSPIGGIMMAGLRYKCQCANGEVLQVGAAFDPGTEEVKFLWTMRRLWKDVHFEVEQHLARGTDGEAAIRSPAETLAAK